MALLRSRLLPLYRFAACVALLAMLVPVGTSLIHHPAAQTLIRICGMEQGGATNPDKAPAHKTPSCPICQTMHLLGSGFVPPDTPVVAAVSFVASAYEANESAFILIFVPSSQAQSRAPPVLV